MILECLTVVKHSFAKYSITGSKLGAIKVCGTHVLELEKLVLQGLN